ncbi:unnamed protein product [Sphenostylis stenocarpa]|uniref:Methyltransferase n=1 Tax=Sphenostylis stenocarpa TaxID=92480 RepID=A0AA86SX47_9FABA|nr:unnamed protein product [Sphenostylis stenocarpa]
MDRILRPYGYAIIRESIYFTDAITTIAKGMRWECHKEDTENGSDIQKILVGDMLVRSCVAIFLAPPR